MPTTVYGSPLSVIVRLRILASPPNRRCHKPYPITTERLVPGPMLFLDEHASEERARTQRLEKARRDERGRQTLRRAASGEIDAALCLDKEEPADRLGELARGAQVEEVGLRVRTFLDAVGGIRVPHPDEAVGRGERERVEQHAAHDAEDRGVGADPERQRREGHDGKSGRRAKPAQRVAQILFELVGDRHATFLSLAPKVLGAAIVFREFEISEPASRFGVGLVGRPPLALEPRRQGLEVKGKFLVDLGGDSRA